MTAVRRWALVALVAAVLVTTPTWVGLLPADGSDASAGQVRQRIAASATVAWSGEVSTRGNLDIPETSSFGGVGDLLGENTSLRVWWADRTHWRVDNLRQTGETDLVRDASSLTRWVFESNTATVTPYAKVRLPDTSDILPSRLAARLLAGATSSELSRLPSRRVAGRSAVGLRLRPRTTASTIGRVDVWADDSTGLPLRVEVFARRATVPVITSAVTTFDPGAPGARTVQFVAPDGVTTRSRDAVDVAAGANAFAPFVLPAELSGLARQGDEAELGAVGVYGRGPTALVAVPLRRRLSSQVRTQLSAAATATDTSAGTSLQVGPLSVLLTRGGRGRGTFLLAGTVTPATLAKAATELAAQVTFR